MDYLFFYLVIGFVGVFGKHIKSSDETILNSSNNFNETYKALANLSESQNPNGPRPLPQVNSTDDVVNLKTEPPLYPEDKQINFTEGSSKASLILRNTDKIFENDLEMTTSYGEVNKENLKANLIDMTDERISSFLLTTASICNCLNEETNYCECDSKGGIINARSGMTGTYMYNIDVKPTEKLMIFLSANDIDFSESDNCSFTVGDVIFDNSSKFLNPERILLFEKSVNVTEHDTGSCYWKIAYRIGRQNNESSMETAMKGTFKAPPDLDALQLYRPMTRRLWNVVPGVSNCSIEMTVRGLDLGSSSQTWDGLNGNETGSKADFLAVGAGKLANNESVSLKDTLLYGQSESPLTFTFDECEAHVMFVSDMHYQNASGFTVQYKVINDDLRANLDSGNTTVIQDGIHPIPSVVLYVNGIIVNKERPMTNSTREFRESIADMANLFVTRKNFELFGINHSLITEDDILVYDIALCQSIYCSAVCAAFNFSVNIKRSDGSWLFTTDRLNEMFVVLDLKDSWSDNKEIEVCHLEIEFDTTWRWIGFGGIVTLLIIIVVISLIYKISEAIYNESSLAKGTIRDRPTSYRNDISTSHSDTSHRFTLPSGRRRNNQNNVREPSEWNYNISGFEQFDPVGERVDPRSCGLDEEVVHDRTSVTFYSNSAYDGDEHELFSQDVIRTPQNSNSNHSIAVPQSQNDAYSSDESEIGDFDNNRQI